MAVDLLRAADRFATALHVPLYEEARALRQRQQSHNLVRGVTAPPLEAGGLPVLLVGGLLDTPGCSSPSRTGSTWLTVAPRRRRSTAWSVRSRPAPASFAQVGAAVRGHPGMKPLGFHAISTLPPL